MIPYLNRTPHAAHLRVNEELTIFEKRKKSGMGFVIRRGETKEHFYIKKEK